jgi:uncharacterized protein
MAPRLRRTPLRRRRRATTDTGATLEDTIVAAGVGEAALGVAPIGSAPLGIAPVGDDDVEEAETGPLRRCVVTRERLPKERMLRFVVSPERVLIPDLAGKLPGRGIWLSASRDVIEGATGTNPGGMRPGGTRPDGMLQNGKPAGQNGKPAGAANRELANRELIRAVARAARGPVQVPPDLPGVLETALIRRIGDLLGLARRAGQAISGFEKARDWMKTHPVGLVLQAADGSVAERARFRSAVPDAVPVLAPLTGAELGRVFGHDTVVHVALAAGRLANAIAIEAGRLAGIRTRIPTDRA